MGKGYHSQFDEDEYRLPEGMQRIAYDADTEQYTFRDCSGQLYQSSPGVKYGVLKPVAAPRPHRRNVTITEIPDPTLREWARHRSSSKTFNDILPSGYITSAQSGAPPASPMSVLASPERLVQVAKPKVQGIIEIVRRRTMMWRPAGKVSRNGSLMDETKRLLGDSAGRKDDGFDSRLTRSKSEMRPSGYFSRKLTSKKKD